ncbi:MAG: hypothetical protein JXA89_24685 [Anaerolineae bacterium]|nr:hypothetical protein [Anaerolineae bacterium]
MSTIGKDIARGCGRAMVIRVIAIVVGVPLAGALIAILLALASAFEARPWVLVVAGGVSLVLLFGAAAAFMFIVIYQRKNKLDALFAPLGLSGKAYDSFFRQYHGTMQDRQVDVWFYRGPVLEIEVSTSLQTRLGVTGPHADTRFLAGLAGRQPLPLNDPTTDDLTVFAHDEGWTRALLANPHAVELVRQLIALDSMFSRQQVILRPGTFRLMLSGSRRLFGIDLEPERVHCWVNALLRLVHIAEHLPAPQVTDEISSAEQFARRLRNRNPYWTLWVALGTVVFILACSAVVTAAVIWMANM